MENRTLDLPEDYPTVYSLRSRKIPQEKRIFWHANGRLCVITRLMEYRAGEEWFRIPWERHGGGLDYYKRGRGDLDNFLNIRTGIPLEK